MDGNTEAVVHAFRVDGIKERQRREGRQDVTIEQQIKFMRTQRKFWADMRLPKGVQMAAAILASLERLSKFSRQKR